MAMAARSLAPLLLVLSALFSAASAARTVGDAVQDACSKSQFPKVCVDGLSAKPESQKATPRRLAELFVGIAADKGTGMATFLEGKFNNDQSKDDAARGCYDGCGDDVEEAVAHLTAVAEGPTDAKFLELKSWLSSTLGGTAVCEDACKDLPKSTDKDEVLKYSVDFENMLRVTLDLITEASGSMSADIALPPSDAAGAPAPAPSSVGSGSGSAAEAPAGSEGPAASAAAPQSSGPSADSPAAASDAPAPSSGDGSGAPAPSGSSAADGPSGDSADAPGPASAAEEDGDDTDSSDDTKA